MQTLYLSSLILGGIGAWVIGISGQRLGLLDSPNSRSSHRSPTPTGGGIGILVSFAISSSIIQIPLLFWIPATFLALMSFLGDKFDFSPKFRLPLQFVAAIILYSGIKSLHLTHIESLLLIVPLTIFMVGTANFFNFMDGINGIAAITGIVGFGLLSAFTIISEYQNSCSIICICLSLACLGFLPFNFPNAKVFMGDIGSILLGFVFAGMVVWLSESLLDFICLASLLFPFYADELTTMAVRIKDGENLLQAHRRHLYQLLANEREISHWKISLGYGLFQLIVGITVLLVRSYGGIVVLSTLGAYFGIFILVSFVVRKDLSKPARSTP